MTHLGPGPFSPEQQANLGVDVYGRHGPEAEPGSPGNPSQDAEDLIAALMAEGEAAEERDRALATTRDIQTTGATATTGTTTRDITGETVITSDELIKQRSRVYIDVPTPEEFLNEFENSFAGFAADMTAAGMSGGDLNAMFNPVFLNSMLNEYMGNLAQKAAAGEDIFEVAGVGGAEQFLGTRTGAVTTQQITRMTRTQATETLRERGQQVTEENLQTVINEDIQRQQDVISQATTTTQAGTQTQTTDQAVTTRRDETVRETGTRRFEEIEEIWRRPKLTPIFKFSPLDFLGERFGDDIGRLTTEIRASAPRQRPGGGGPTQVAVAARRA